METMENGEDWEVYVLSVLANGCHVGIQALSINLPFIPDKKQENYMWIILNFVKWCLPSQIKERRHKKEKQWQNLLVTKIYML